MNTSGVDIVNNRNFKGLPPRRFPKQQYVSLTHKIGLCLILPVLLVLIGGGIGVTCYHHQIHHHTYHVVHKHVKKSSPSHKDVKHRSKAHQIKLKPINVKQGEHLLGQWLRKLNYPTNKAQSILTTYQKQNETQESKNSQTLNQLTHSSVSTRVKIQRIRHFINKI